MATREYLESMLSPVFFASETSRDLAISAMLRVIEIERGHAEAQARLDPLNLMRN